MEVHAMLMGVQNDEWAWETRRTFNPSLQRHNRLVTSSLA